MGFGIGFRVAPGVRFRVTRKGPRVSLGPRIARVHLGGGRPAVSTGAGPVTLWSTLSGGGSTSRSGSSRQDKARAWEQARDRLDRLLGAHEGSWQLAHRPVLPDPDQVNRHEVRSELLREATAGVPWWNLAARWRARQDVDEKLPEVLAQRQAAIDAEHAAAQAEADRWWQKLCDNDPVVTADRLEQAFDDNVLPAAVAAIEADIAHVVVTIDEPQEVIGEREPTLTEKGNLSLARMTQTRRNELYGQAVVASVLAVACETFAVAPGIARTEVAVVQPEVEPEPAVIALAELARDDVLAVDGTTARLRQPASAILGDGRLVTRVGGRTDALQPLPREQDDDIAMLLDTIDLADE